MQASSAPASARALGVTGLIPFWAAALAAAFAAPPWDARASAALFLYGAVILSFLGAVHWGLALREADGPARDRAFVASVIPALWAWFCAFAPGTWSFIGLIVGFLLMLIYDWDRGRAGALPAWYPGLRIWLTLGAVAALLLGLSLGPAEGL